MLASVTPHVTQSQNVPYSYSPVLHYASLLRIILRVIGARALQNGGFFFAAGPRQRGKSSFSRKRAW